MTAQQLKNSILQMAVQGKLVPQDPTDEPASVLLERIRAEKEKLIREGKIKREKTPSVIFRGADNLPYEKCGDEAPVCIADEVPFDIPDSWEWVKLPAIGISELGKTLDKGKNTGNPRPYLCSINVYWNEIDLSQVKTALFTDEELPKYALQIGDVLICEGGDVGRAAIWNDERPMYYQNALHRVRFIGGMLPEFFVMLMECYKGLQILDKYSKGMTIKHLVQSSLKDIIFPLPPIKEQERVVERLKQLKPFIEYYDEKNTSLQKLNGSFPSELKKSILQMAIQGKLVPQDPTDEPAETLLVRIREQKEQLIKEGKIKRDKHKSFIFRRDNSHYELVDGVERCIDDEIPFVIPDSWAWCRLGSLILEAKDGPHYSPKYVDKGIPFLSARNITMGKIDFSTAKFISHELHTELQKRCHPKKGDILYTKGGTTGIAVVNDTDLVFDVWVHVAVLSLGSIVNPSFLAMALNSPHCYAQSQALTHGTGNRDLGLTRMVKITVPYPPLAEQRRILARLNEYWSVLDKMPM